MPRFAITNENTEDTLDLTDSLEEAIRIARDAARQGPAGDPVSVEHEGKTVRQFVLMTDGTVVEQKIA